MNDKLFAKHFYVERKGDWPAAPPWVNLGQMHCTWLSSDWKYLLSRQQRTMYSAACPSRGAAVSCQGNSCFHPPKGKITHSLHSQNSFLFLLVSVYKKQMLQYWLITSISFVTFLPLPYLHFFWKSTLSILFQRLQYRIETTRKTKTSVFPSPSLLFPSPSSSLVWFSRRLSQLLWCLLLWLLLSLLGEAQTQVEKKYKGKEEDRLRNGRYGLWFLSNVSDSHLDMNEKKEAFWKEKCIHKIVKVY